MDKQKITEFSSLFLKLRDKNEVYSFLVDIFSPSEIEKIMLRWEIAKLLLSKKQYSEIERTTGSSSATIAKVAESIKYGEGGLELLLKRLK